MSAIPKQIRIEELPLLDVDRPFNVSIEGWIVGVMEFFLVDDRRNPVIKIILPAGMDNILLENIPEQFRVGGQYAWVEKATIYGTVVKRFDKAEFLSIERLEPPELQKTIVLGISEAK